MEKNKVDFFIAANSDKFEPTALLSIKNTLEGLNDDQFMMVQALEYRDPTMILLVAILLGWERFFLGDVAMGILKILTCYGFGIWWLADCFTATQRARKYNFNKFSQAVALMS